MRGRSPGVLAGVPVGVLSAVLVLLLGGCLPDQAERADGAGEAEEVRAQVEARQDSFLAALAARDAGEAAAHFAADAVLHVANMPPVEGRDAIHGFYGNVFAFMEVSEAAAGPVRVAGSADMAWSTGQVSNAFRSNGERVQYEGKYLLVWEARDGAWEIVVYSISSNEAQP